MFRILTECDADKARQAKKMKTEVEKTMAITAKQLLAQSNNGVSPGTARGHRQPNAARAAAGKASGNSAAAVRPANMGNPNSHQKGKYKGKKERRAKAKEKGMAHGVSRKVKAKGGTMGSNPGKK